MHSFHLGKLGLRPDPTKRGLLARVAPSRVLLALFAAVLFCLFSSSAAQAQSVSLALGSTTFIEGDPNQVAGTVSLNGPAITSPVTVNITYTVGGNTTLVSSVVFQPGEENTAKDVSITVGDDTQQGNRPVTVTATAVGPAPYGGLTDTVNATQIDPHGVFLTEISGKNSESDAQRGARQFLDVSLVDPDNPSSNLAEITPTGNVFVTIRAMNPLPSDEDTDEAFLATDAQPVFQQQQVLVFTPQDFQQPQRVYVQGRDDNISDGDQIFSVRVRAIASSDPEYNNLAGPQGITNNLVLGVNVDNESNPSNNLADVIVNPSSIETNENGSITQFSVVLATAPSADVTVNFQTSDPTEGRLLTGNVEGNTTSITFSPDDTAPNGFSTPQIVRVKGQDDALSDGDINYRIITTTSSLDSNYAAIDPPDVAAINRDNESPGLTVSPRFLLVFEGQSANITAVLNQVPTDQVRFALSVSDPTQIQLNRTELVFTPANFNVPQTIIVNGIDDNIVDGDQPFTITVGNAASSDPGYNGRFGTTVTGTVVDTDVARVNIQPPGGLTTSESGGTATFSVSLASRPQPNTTVTINVTSSDTTEGRVAPASLVFTPANFSTPQTVTITGVDDLLRDGNVDYQIDLQIAGGAGSDPNYAALTLQPVTVTNTDAGERAGVSITPQGGLVTTEAGGTATFTVRLNDQPTNNVTLNLSSSDPSEGMVSPASITFTPANFNQSRTVTVTGVDDKVDDGNRNYSIVTAALISNDPTYKFNPVDVLAVNLDDDVSGFTITPTTGLITREGGGTATFKVRLNSQPTAPVTIALTTPFTSEISFAPKALTFTTANYAADQTVTVTGLDDNLLDGNRNWVIVTVPDNTTTDATYKGLNPSDVTGVNQDDDTARVVFSPTNLIVREGQQGTFSVTLSAKPAADVVVPLAVNDTTEVVISKTELIFTSANFSTPQQVRVTGLNDGIADGNQSVTLTAGPTASSDTVFNNLSAAASINVLDVVMPAGLNITGPSSTTTTEAGSTATFGVTLSTQPGANVNVTVSSTDTTEGRVSPATLTFTPFNWNQSQPVTVTGANDFLDDGNQPYQVRFVVSSTDNNYSNINSRVFNFTNVDDDGSGFTVTPTTGLTTTEAGGTAVFTVRLNSQPTANVTIGISTPFTAEISLTPASLTFTPANFNVPQQVTVKGKDDKVVDGNRTWVVVTTADSTTTDTTYKGLNPSDVTGTNQDDDTAGIVLSPSTLIIREGEQANIAVSLSVAPKSNVIVPLSVNDTSEVVLGKTQLTFTPANFNIPQNVPVTGLNDSTSDGNVAVVLTAGPTTSADGTFNNLNATANITVLDVVLPPGLTITDPGATTTTEVTGAGNTVTFNVSLNTQPSSNVTVAVASTDTTEGRVTPATLTFTPFNFNVPQPVTLTGVDDFVDDGDVAYQVRFTVTSTDANYKNIAPRLFNFANIDNDTAGFTVRPGAGLLTGEDGTSATFTLNLNSQPTANVTIGISTPFTKEISVAPASLTFTPANYNTPQTVTVTGVDDSVADGDRNFVVVTSPDTTTTDVRYKSLNPPDLSGKNQDNEKADYSFSPTILVTTEGRNTDFFLRLTLRPTSDVFVPISVSDPTEVRSSTNGVTFTPANFNVPQRIILTGVNDNTPDGNQRFNLLLGRAISSDPAYSGNFPKTIPGTNIDTNVPGVVVNAPAQLTTTETGGTATFSVALQTAPGAGNTVTIQVTSSNPQEGVVNPTTLVFDELNFDLPQTVTVTGVDDNARDGNKAYRIGLRVVPGAPPANPDPQYANVTIPFINAINIDNGSSGLTFGAVSGNTSEDGGTATFSVQISGTPAQDVTVTLSSSDLTEGILIDPATSLPVTGNSLVLSFPQGTGNQPQDVTVQGVDDNIVDGTVAYFINARLTSSDTNYNNLTDRVSLSNTDNDVPGFIVTPNITPPATGLSVNENGTSASFTISLNTQPTGNVVIDLVSNKPDEATVRFSRITFTPGTPTTTVPSGQAISRWNTPVTVFVTGVADNVADGDQNWNIIISRNPPLTLDPAYKALDPADVSGTTVDIDQLLVGVTITPTRSIFTSETDEATRRFQTFSVRLNSRPGSDVVIPITVTDKTEGAFVKLDAQGRLVIVNGAPVKSSSMNLTFTQANFGTAQTVAIIGLDDTLEDGDQLFQVNLGPTISRNLAYNNLLLTPLDVTNRDDDDFTIPTVTISSPTDGAITNRIIEIAGTAADAVGTGAGTPSGIKSVGVTLFRVANAAAGQTAGYYNPATKKFEPILNLSKHLLPAKYNGATQAFSVLLPLSGVPPTLAAGNYRVQAYATDVKGNQGVSEIVTFTVDTTAPTVKLTTPTAGTYSTAPQATGSAEDNKGGSGVNQIFITVFRAEDTVLGNTAGFLLPDGTYSTTLGPENLLAVVPDAPTAAGVVNFTFDFPDLGPGRFTITAQADDLAGNIGKSAPVVITLRNIGGTPDFVVGQTYLFSLPYADTAAAGATTTPDKAFNVAMFDPVTGEQRYLLSRYNPLTSSYELLDANTTLVRGEGYFIRPLTANVRILRSVDDESRIPLDINITTWVYTLRRNPSASPTDPTNGFNLIGDPFNPDGQITNGQQVRSGFIAADWQNAVFSDGTNTYVGVAAAAAAGLVDSRLFDYNGATGEFVPVTGNIEVFKGYFVRTFKDNVKVTVSAIAPAQG